MPVFGFVQMVLVLFMSTLALTSHAQSEVNINDDNNCANKEAKLWMPKNIYFTLENPKAIFDLFDKYPAGEFGQKLISHNKSNHGMHYHFIQTYLNREIFGTELLVSTDFNNKLIAVSHNFPEIQTEIAYPSNISDSMIWFYSNGNLLPVTYHKNRLNHMHLESLTDDKGEVIYQVDAKRYHLSPPDSAVTGFVFYPDPLTSSNTVYGEKISDLNDSATTLLNAERKNVTFRSWFQNDSFRLGDEYLKFSEVSTPKTPRVVTKLPIFNYTRNQPQFEEVNVFYHLSSFRKHIQNLGFIHWIDTLLVDCHAFDGADQSAYDPLVTPHTLEFGDGGVDDAEDADVAIHEYLHSISFKASPGKNIGSERKAIEEGICDYFAMSYSRSLSNNQTNFVYNWDGHNTFWPGRSTNSSGTYPTALTGDIYISGQIFSSALSNLFDLIGRDTCDKLVLSILPYLSAGITMPQASRIILKVDSLVFKVPHTKQIYLAFTRKNLLQWPLNIKSILAEKKSKTILVNGLSTVWPNHNQCQVYSTEGKLIFTSNENQITDKALLLSEGIYIGLFLNEDHKLSVYKIIRY